MISSAGIIAGQIALLVGLGLVLIKATNLTASAVEALINHSRQRKFGLVVFLVALSTSLPELIVSTVASLNGQGELALANIIGANIANISLILGGAALIAGSLKASDTIIKKEMVSVFLIGCLPLLLLMDQQLSRLEGLALILLYIIYIQRELVKKQKQAVPPPKAEEQIKNLLHKLGNHTLEKRLLLVGVGLILMLLSAEGIVRTATALANFAQVPSFLIGLFVVSVGTSLPELLFEIVAIRHHQSTMAFGNIIGSMVANGTVILGLAALIRPIQLTASMPSYLISIMGFILIFGLFWLFTKSKHRLDRWEGLALVAAYGVFGLIQWVVR